MTSKRDLARRLESLEGESGGGLEAITEQCGGLNIVYTESGLEDLPEEYPTVVCNPELVDRVKGNEGWRWIDGSYVYLPEEIGQ